MSEPVGTYAPLAVSGYRKVWGAAVVSNVGTFLQLTAGPWLMNELTGSPLMVSLVTAALSLPRLLLTIPAGALADALDRRNLMITGNLVGAVSTGAMAIMVTSGTITAEWLLAWTFLLGVGSAITLPAQQTLVPDLVPANMRAQAITLNSAAFNVARAVGPSIGGLLVSAGLTAASFGINAATFVLVVGVLLSFPRQPAEDAQRHLFRSAALGMRYVRFTRPIRRLIVIAGVFMLTASSVQTLLPVVASDDLAVGATGFGLLYGALGLGALAGVAGREAARVRLGRHMLPGAIAAFGLGGIAFGLAPGPWIAGLAMAVSGVMWVWTLITLNASIQTLAPRWVRGRVVSLYLLAIGLQPFGAVLSGAIAEVTGAGMAVAILSVGTVALGLFASRLELPVLGEIDEPVIADNWQMPRHATQVAGTPVLVATTWEVDPDDVEAFMDHMRELRRTRLRTGAHRWSLYRDADRPYRITEFMVVADWDEHLAQHARIDTEAAEVIRRSRAFDRADGPVTRHLAGLDILASHAPPIADQLITVHEQLHAHDGSTPLDHHDTDAPSGSRER
ncbi:MFS transporter [Euzebya pacifica]|uniref:MFS transporter n=1 Tax=Euzebya pacifica TaxID=1608957 RepID=UPI0030F5AAB3